MIKVLERNVGNYFAGGTEKSHHSGGRDEVIGQKKIRTLFIVGGSLIGDKTRAADYNIKYSRYYRLTKV